MDLNEIRSRLTNLTTAHLADADKKLRVVSPAIRPVQSGLKLVGCAFTVNCHNDFLTVIKSIHDAKAGDVIVIETQGSRLAVAGELFVAEAMRKGIAGFVIDGAFRDTAAVRKTKFPVYAHTITPMSGTAKRAFHTQVAIECGGITVHPGDLVFGDDDGLLVLSLEEAAHLMPVAEDIKAKEELVLARVQAGEGLHNLTNFEEHWQKIEAGEKSELTFLVD
ncbi:RraA family protein [Endozoicomonas sp.]|uniref:RraA family protein n=1 Tax=Endozoicomonas sp. TaxID=1892382 RepID=UPI0028875022|nr:RraA family protein [Endozoicomonas sp.]